VTCECVQIRRSGRPSFWAAGHASGRVSRVPVRKSVGVNSRRTYLGESLRVPVRKSVGSGPRHTPPGRSTRIRALLIGSGDRAQRKAADDVDAPAGPVGSPGQRTRP